MTRVAHRNRRAWVALAFGALSLGTGLAWMLSAAWGVSPLDAFIAGAAEVTGLTIGTVIVLLSLVFVVASWVLGSRPGLGTPIVFVGVGAVVDVWNIVIFDALTWTPADWSVAARVALWIVGFVLFAGGIIATLASGLGANPYDQIVLVVHERFGIPLALSRLLFDAVILLAAFLIGGAWGVGTVAILILMPLALGWLTPRFHSWVHALHAEEQASQVAVGGATGK